MPDTKTIAVAEAVRATLAASIFAEPILVARGYVPAYKREALQSSNCVSVLPTQEESLVTGRAYTTDTCQVDVVLQVAVDPTDVDAVDAKLDLVEAMKAVFRFGARHAGYSWIGTRHLLYDEKLLREGRLLQSGFTLTFKGMR